MSSSNNKRIAKNTLYLYVRMLIVMLVSLYTVRVVLNALGAMDYGINNVVSGVVVMFSFLTSSMVAASQRFFAFYLGQNDTKKLSEYFIVSFWSYVGFIVLIFILAETLGLWFVMTQLTIPSERMGAAIWAYQCAIISFCFSIVSIPYNSIIIAREKMNIYAFGGLVEAFLKLLVAYLITLILFDKLKVYSVLMCVMMGSVNVFYIVYCLRKFPECRIKRFWDKNIFKEVMSYSLWNLFGALSVIIRSQGINILLNMFFNPVVNAARAIAYQVNGAINQFVNNFYKAVQPQITKYYAANDQKYLESLVFRSSRFCFYLIFLLSLPILIETPFVLKLWLKNLPENTVLFTRLVIIIAIIDSISYPLQTSISATGRIKYFQIVTGGLLLMNLPIAWLLLHWGYPPESTMYIAMAISIIAQVTRVYFAKEYNHFSVIAYTHGVLRPIFAVGVLSILIPIMLLACMDEGYLRFVLVLFSCMSFTTVFVWSVGITPSERHAIITAVHSRLPWKRK